MKKTQSFDKLWKMFVCTNDLPRARWFNQIGSCITEQLIQAHHQYGVGWRPAL